MMHRIGDEALKTTLLFEHRIDYNATPPDLWTSDGVRTLGGIDHDVRYRAYCNAIGIVAPSAPGERDGHLLIDSEDGNFFGSNREGPQVILDYGDECPLRGGDYVEVTAILTPPSFTPGGNPSFGMALQSWGDATEPTPISAWRIFKGSDGDHKVRLFRFGAGADEPAYEENQSLGADISGHARWSFGWSVPGGRFGYGDALLGGDDPRGSGNGPFRLTIWCLKRGSDSAILKVHGLRIRVFRPIYHPG